MTKVIKRKAVEIKDAAENITKNLIEFVQAASLVTVAAFGAYAVKASMVTSIFAYILAGAAAIIAVRGAFELLRTFNK